jgi:hypothetical protein
LLEDNPKITLHNISPWLSKISPQLNFQSII